MLDGALRGYKDRLLRPLARALPEAVSPMAVTLAGLAVGLAAAALAALGMRGAAVTVFLVNRLLDGLDGLIARERGRQSDFGGYIDILVDFLVYAAIPIGVSFQSGSPNSAGVLVILLSLFYVNSASWLYLSALSEKRRTESAAQGNLPTSIPMPRGLVEGTETILFYLVMLALPQSFALVAATMALATAVGVVQRILWARAHFT